MIMKKAVFNSFLTRSKNEKNYYNLLSKIADKFD